MITIILIAKTPVGTCALCLDGLIPSYRSPKLICLLRCGHYFHSHCIERMFQAEQLCPLCQKDTVKFWPNDYANVRRILNRHQREKVIKQPNQQTPISN